MDELELLRRAERVALLQAACLRAYWSALAEEHRDVFVMGLLRRLERAWLTGLRREMDLAALEAALREALRR